MQPMNCPGRWFILERHPRASGDTPEGRVESSEPFDDTAGDGSDAHFFEFKRGINPRGSEPPRELCSKLENCPLSVVQTFG